MANAYSLMLILLLASPVCAQDRQPSVAVDLATHVLLDPTTYVPALLGYDAMSRDWASSQPLFARGYVEHNPEFTVGGVVDGRPVSFAVGRSRILSDFWLDWEVSTAHNVGVSLLERALIERHPTHARLIRRLGWVEKTAAASWLSYHWSAARYRQAAANQTLGR